MAAASVGPDDAAVEQTTSPGGWKRVLVGLLVGLVAGALVALVLPRENRTRAAMPAARELPRLPAEQTSRGLAGPADHVTRS